MSVQPAIIIIKAMGETQVFVIRLFVNSSVPHALRGSIESIREGDIKVFTDGESLLNNLTQMMQIHKEPFLTEIPDEQSQNLSQ